MARAMSLAFTFEVALDDVKLRVSNRPGDVLRLRAMVGTLDEDLAAGGLAAYETMFRFAWQALRHADGYEELGWEEFIDRVTEWGIVDDEKIRPTVEGPSSAP